MHLYFNGITIGLDNSKADVSFLSHAHSDHTTGFKRQKKIIATDETLALAGFEPSRNCKPETLNRKLATGNCSLLPAGHMLGSRQFSIEEDGKRTVYTGDISLKQNIFGEKAQIPECDRLIMEATYGSDPKYKFPDHEAIYDSISKFIKQNDSSNIIIGAYEMGKAQEMVKILNARCDITPIVTEKTERICKIYGQFGVKLDRLEIGTEEAEEIMNDRFVALVPMMHAKRYFAKKLSEAFGKKTLCTAVTGWALTTRLNNDMSFPLSDHADFFELKEYIESSGAKNIEFFCGDGHRLLKEIRR
jgi:putative mRNA 3-end processing factor